MKCPKCEEGNIRVFVNTACDCWHFPLMCDKCFSLFVVECGEPLGSGKLPPEYPMEFEKEATEHIAEVVEDLSGLVEELPLLEDFKASLP